MKNRISLPSLSEIVESKQVLRAEFRSRRGQLSEAERADRSAAICRRLQSLPEIAAAGTVHVYWPLLHRGEIDIRPFVQWLSEQEKRIVMPVVQHPPADADREPRMLHRVYTTEACLVQNQWGLCEPGDGACVAIDEIDLIVVPALGVGRNGHRIGYGRGYYDAFLRDARAVTVCPVYAECLVPYIAPEPHDVPVSIIVSDREVIRTASS